MFTKNDKSLFLIRKIINVVTIIVMCICVIAGIVLIALSFGENAKGASVFYVGTFISGICTLILGPIFTQFTWLLLDMKFNSILDLKIIRNAQFGLAAPELPCLCMVKRCKGQTLVHGDMSTYDILKEYKTLVDEEVITKDEFDEIKSQLLNKEISKENQVESTIDKIKKLKSYLDEEVISAEEFEKEKSKILKK